MPDEAQSIEIDHETIGHILADKKSLRVPENQRSYAWKKEHIIQLFEDFAGQLPKEYFLGSIVVVAKDGAIEVHDGQQRIATSVILIAAIRDCFLRLKDETSAKTTEDDFLFATGRRSHERMPRFRLNNEDNDYFIKRVLLRPDDPERKAVKLFALVRESNERIAEAAMLAEKYVAAIIATFSDKDQLDRLHGWLDFIETSARVIWVEVKDERTAFRIFETMNDRGLKLSSADLLKNCIYSNAEDRKQESLQKWQSMCAVLESIEDEEEGIVDYLRYYWICEHGPIRSKDLYDAMRAGVTNKTRAMDLAADLELRATEYGALLNASHEQWARYGPDMKHRIRDLRILGVRQVRPILMAAFRHFKDNELLRLFAACVNWSVRCLIGGVPSGTLESYYGKCALQITQGHITDSGAALRQVIEIIPNDERFKSATALANVAQAHLARYYLRTLQETADGKPGQYQPADSASVTLEHVLPRKPGAGWEHIKPEEAKTYVNRLGNQALLEATANHDVGNAPFEQKKAILSASEFSLTKEIGLFPKWNLESIAERQVYLSELALKAWPLLPL